MPRFAVVTMVLLLAIIAAGAAALWYGGWMPGLAEQAAGPLPAAASPQGPADRAAAAIKAHDLEALRGYLAEGGDPDGADTEGETLLNKAVLSGTPEILDVLLGSGADPNVPGRNGLGPLTLAALSGRQAMLERLMQANAERVEGRRIAVSGPGLSAADKAAADAGGAATDHAAPVVQASGRAVADARALAGGTDATAPLLAALAGDGAPQAVMPGEPQASMAGLVINPVARPAGGATATANVSAPPLASPAGAAAASPAGDVPPAWVSAAQRRLGQLGYYKGPITGFAGPLTADAVKRYQAVAGIRQDGVVTPELLRRIGATVEAPREAPAAAARPSAAATPGVGPAAAVDQPSPAVQQVRHALGQEFNSASRPDTLRQHCQANANTWVYDEAIGRSLFCRDVIGSPPR
jgi:hypothetical protein